MADCLSPTALASRDIVGRAPLAVAWIDGTFIG